MAISFPRDFPVSIRTSMINLSVNQAIFESAFTRQQQTQEHAAGKGDRWEGVWVTPSLSTSDMKALKAWLVSLKGQINTFKAYDPDNRTLENAPGNALVAGASQTGTSINVDGWPLSQTVMLAGEFFQFEDEFKMCLEDVVTNGSGQATINFEPAIRTSPANNATVIVTNPFFIARLADVYGGTETNQNKIGVVSITFEEVT